MTSSPARPAPVLPVPPEVFQGDGPVTSVYLTTDGALPQAAAEAALRWKTLRQHLRNAGADESAVAAIDPVVEGAQAVGQCLVALSSPAGLLYTAYLPRLPDRDHGSTGPLPHVVPLLAQTQRLLPHLVVVIDRLGAEMIAVLPDRPDLHTAVTGDELHVTRSAPGGWSQRRFQQRAENRWEANAREVADAVTRLADATAPRLVVVSGDVRAVQLLRTQLPVRVSDLVHEVQGDYSSLEEALSRSQELVAAVADDDTALLLADYRRERGSGGLAAAGPDPTLDALHAGQVETLLLDPQALQGRTAWFGPDGHQVGGSQQGLQARGVAGPRPAPLGDVAVRAAVGTAAAVHIVPPGTLEPGDGGIAALLRYR